MNYGVNLTRASGTFQGWNLENSKEIVLTYSLGHAHADLQHFNRSNKKIEKVHDEKTSCLDLQRERV